MAKRAEGTVRKALQRRASEGVGDLLEEVVQVREVELARIRPNPHQPRRIVDSDGIAELARSIEAHGLLQPIVLRPEGREYELVAGSRRLAAHEQLGRARITAVILPDADGELLALIENLQRADLDPVDEAQALRTLKERGDYTLEDLRRLVGRSLSYLSEMMSVLRLPPAILDEVRSLAAAGKPVPRASLVELARIDDAAAQARAWSRIAAGITGRAEIREARQQQKPAKPTAGAGAPPSPRQVVRRIEELKSALSRFDPKPVRDRAGLHQALMDLRHRIDSLLAETG
jgi:ParB family chromosome partitioning protein